MAIVTTIRRSIWAKIYSLKKWRNVIIDIMVILVIPLPIVLLSCSKRGEWPFEKSFQVEPLETLDCPRSAQISFYTLENRQKVESYPVGDSEKYLVRLGLSDINNVTVNQANPVIITAASWDNFPSATRLIKRLQENVSPRLKIVVYDMGLSETEKEQICANFTCKLRKFAIRQYPVYLENIPKATWKPLIIQVALQEFSFVIWMDSAVYLYDGHLQPGIDIARAHWIAAGYKRLTFPDINLAFETDIQTFDALGEEPCAFENRYKFNGALIFIRRSKFTYRYIMRPWVSCALTKSCIAAFRESNSKCIGAQTYGHCHRFDQSVLSIILNRVFSNNLEEIDIGNKVKWTKCFIDEYDLIFNEIVFHDKTGHVVQCPN